MGVVVREKPIGSGTWWVFINHRGRRKSKRVGSEKAAIEAAQKIEAKLTLREFDIKTDDRKAPLFNKMAERWLSIHIKQTKRQTTHDRYKSLLRLYLNPILGKIPMNELKRADVIGALRSIQGKGKSKSTVEVARNVISGVCEFAIDEEYLNDNPCVGVIKRLGYQRKKDRKPIVVFTQEEAEAILQKCREYRPQWYPLFLIAFRAGLRLGEILALEWTDINWRQGYILVQRSFRNGRTTPTKNGRPRRVDMTDQLISVMKRLHLKRKEEALALGKDEPTPIIFHTDGMPTSQNTIRNIWGRLLDKCGLEYRKIHTTRHTFASLLISRGESLAYVKELMGHSSIQITCDIYGHLLPTENRNILNSLDTPNRTLYAPDQKLKAVTP